MKEEGKKYQKDKQKGSSDRCLLVVGSRPLRGSVHAPGSLLGFPDLGPHTCYHPQELTHCQRPTIEGYILSIFGDVLPGGS